MYCAEIGFISVRFSKHTRTKLFVFSFVSRSQGDQKSAK